MTELEEALALLCQARHKLEGARARARRELDELHDPADRMSCYSRVAALGHAEDRVDVALALVSDSYGLEP